jgi:hypothetical protein
MKRFIDRVMTACEGSAPFIGSLLGIPAGLLWAAIALWARHSGSRTGPVATDYVIAVGILVPVGALFGAIVATVYNFFRQRQSESES